MVDFNHATIVNFFEKEVIVVARGSFEKLVLKNEYFKKCNIFKIFFCQRPF